MDVGIIAIAVFFILIFYQTKQVSNTKIKLGDKEILFFEKNIRPIFFNYRLYGGAMMGVVLLGILSFADYSTTLFTIFLVIGLIIPPIFARYSYNKLSQGYTISDHSDQTLKLLQEFKKLYIIHGILIPVLIICMLIFSLI